VSTPSGYSPYASADSSTYSATRIASPAYASFASPSYAGYASPSFAYSPAAYASPIQSAAYKQATFTPSIPYNEQPSSYRPAYSAATYSPVQQPAAVAYRPVAAAYRPAAATSLPGYAANLASLGDYTSGAHYSAGINPGIYSGLGLNAYSGLADYSGLSAYQASPYNFGFQQQQPIYQQAAAYQPQQVAYQQIAAHQPQASYQQAYPAAAFGGGAPAYTQHQLVAQASNKVGPATFGANGGAPDSSSASSSGRISNGGYGFTRAPPS
jgi:hypothetical protein